MFKIEYSINHDWWSDAYYRFSYWESIMSDDVKRLREFWITPELKGQDWFKAYQTNQCKPKLIHVREVMPDEPDYKRMFEMKQDDWIETCKELDRTQRALAKAKSIIRSCVGYEPFKSGTLEPYRCSEGLEEIEAIEKGK